MYSFAEVEVIALKLGLRAMSTENITAVEGILAGQIEGFPPVIISGIRNARGLTPSQFANIVGVSKATVCAWERGEVSPRRNHVRTLCDLVRGLIR
jgi:DNA-binding transcriptional regulator YiaG